jgi:hypothetical protein
VRWFDSILEMVQKKGSIPFAYIIDKFNHQVVIYKWLVSIKLLI